MEQEKLPYRKPELKPLPVRRTETLTPGELPAFTFSQPGRHGGWALESGFSGACCI